MAVNKSPWVKNLYGAQAPLVMLGLFRAGSTEAIKRGEIIHLDTQFKAIHTDEDFTAALAVANEEIKAGDLAGYYSIIVPRPGDVFEFDLATAAATAIGTAMYYSTSQALSTSGSHVIGRSVGQENYPVQGHASDDASGDAGSTIRSQSTVRIVFDEAHSYLKAFQA